MFLENQICQTARDLQDFLREESVARYVTFENLDTEGGHIDGTFLFCNFKNVAWYWGLFNLCTFVHCKFVDCVFRGSSFPGCRFVECTFSRCHFLKDNLNRDCSFEDSRWYDCTQQDCEGLTSYITSGA